MLRQLKRPVLMKLRNLCILLSCNFPLSILSSHPPPPSMLPQLICWLIPLLSPEESDQASGWSEQCRFFIKTNLSVFFGRTYYCSPDEGDQASRWSKQCKAFHKNNTFIFFSKTLFLLVPKVLQICLSLFLSKLSFELPTS